MANAIVTFFYRVLKVISFAGIIACSACALLHFGAKNGYRTAAATIKPITKIVEVEAPTPSVDELLNEIPRQHGIPREVIEVLIEKESAGRRSDDKRCEWQSDYWLSQAKKITNDPEQRDAYRCSYGVMQVAGWHAPRYGLTWADLTDVRTNVEVGTAIFAACYNQAKDQQTRGISYDALRRAYRCYNGAGPRAEAYADHAMQLLTKRVISRYFADA